MPKLFCLILIIFLWLNLSAQKSLDGFRHLTVNDGLAQNTGRCIIQDKFGFIWIGTEAGLSCYNGYEIKNYTHSPNTKNSLSNNYINTLYQGENNTLWIGTDGGGVCYYNQNTGEMHRLESDSAYNLKKLYVFSLLEDNNNNLWIGTKSGLFIYNLLSKKTTYYPTLTSNKNAKCIITNIFIDKNNTVWLTSVLKGIFYYQNNTFNEVLYKKKSLNLCFKIASFNQNLMAVSHNGNIYKIDINNKCITKKHPLSEIATVKNINIQDFIFEDNNNIWIATNSNGVLLYNLKTSKYKQFNHIENNNNSLSTNSIKTIYKDKTNVLWIGTYYKGVDIYDLCKKDFNKITGTKAKPKLFETAGPILQSNNKSLWIGTYGGLYNYFPEKDSIVIYKAENTHKQKLTNNLITKIIQDKDGYIWVSTDNGLNKINAQTQQVEHFLPNNDSCSLKSSSLWALYEDKAGNIWIGSWGNGVFKYNKNKKCFSQLIHNPNNTNSISSNNVINITELKNGKMCFCTWDGGMCLYDVKLKKFENFLNNKKDSTSISHNIVTHVYEDEKNNLWLSTFGGGINQFNPKTKKFKAYTIENGLSDNTLLGALPDQKGNLWIASINGLTVMNLKTKTFQKYDATDGLQSNEFSQHGYNLCQNGNFAFAGVNGINYFHPDSIKLNPFEPNIVLTDFKIFNKPAHTFYKNIIPQNPIITDTIILSWRETVFTFEYAGLHFAMPNEIEYAYKLYPFENEWNYVGNKRFATYTNLPHGTYQFMVKATNNDGIWTKKPMQITIIITPPFWKTKLFYISIIVFIILLFVFIIKFREYKLKQEKKILEEKVEKRTEEIRKQNTTIKHQNEDLKQKQEEIIAQKDQISHQNKHLEHLNEELQQQKEEVLTQRDLVIKQKERIEVMHTNLTDSIDYAKRIQTAILPSKKRIEVLFPESFILFLPHSKVSGDFYYANQIKNWKLIAVADCTGHGVPGAFMSMMGMAFINEIVKKPEVTSPAEVLNQLRTKIIQAMQQKGITGEQKDGMDISFCAINCDNQTCYFAGANNPLYVYRKNNQNEYTLLEFKGDKMPIAIHEKMTDFTNKEIPLHKGDVLYLFSDGYADQFGGPKGKKFKYKPFKQTLQNNCSLSATKQKEKYFEVLSSWMSYINPITNEKYEQIDDITLLGIKIR